MIQKIKNNKKTFMDMNMSLKQNHLLIFKNKNEKLYL